MKIIVLATDAQWQELTDNPLPVQWERATNHAAFTGAQNADAFFYLTGTGNIPLPVNSNTPVFINAVDTTLQELNAPENIVRINAWPGFLTRPVWEIAGKVNDNVTAVLAALGKKASPVADVPGLVAAPVIAMIINEAWFALGDKVSSKEEIDTAMKLGTNYPYGPFEWAEKIGPQNIFALLQKLAVTDASYQPAPLLAAALEK